MTHHIAIRIFLLVALLALAPGEAAALAPSDPYSDKGTDRASQANQAATAFSVVATPDPVVRWMVDQVQQEKARQYIGALSGE